MNIEKLTNELISSVSIQISKYKNLVLSYSGGLDSTVLLDLLFSLKNKNIINNSHFHIRAIHINHNLSKNSKIWEKHCLIECAKRNIKIETRNIYILSKNTGIEKIMREQRYNIIKSIIKKKEVLLTAHHRNDQVETVLLALKRGSGPSGLSAISKNKQNFLLLGYRIIRPLLNFDKKILETYAKYHKLHWIEDESNLNTRFDRNFLRINILPKIYKKWPFFSNSVSRSAQLCSDQELLIDELLQETMFDLIHSDGSLKINSMKEMSEIKRFAIIRRWLLTFRINMPSFKQMCILWNEIVLSRKDSVGKFQIGNKKICKFKNRLYVLPIQENNYFHSIYWSRKKIYVKLPNDIGILFRQEFFLQEKISNEINDLYKKYALFSRKNKKSFFSIETGKKLFKKITIVRSPTCTETVSVRFVYKNNDLLKILGFNCRKRIKTVWKDLEIPRWQRKSTPLLFYNEQLISAIGIFITFEGIPKKQKIWKVFWYHNDNNFSIC